MWHYTNSFFHASYHTDDVSIESNIGPRDIKDTAYLVHEESIFSMHAHHYSLYTQKKCGCFAKATNVVIETYDVDEAPTSAQIHRFFDHTLTFCEDVQQLRRYCAACAQQWSSFAYYADTYYTNEQSQCAIQLTFPPSLLQQATAIVLVPTLQASTFTVYIQQQNCACMKEVGKLSISLSSTAAITTYISQTFQLTVLPATTPRKQRCQTCQPAPSTWTPSHVRYGHYEKWTNVGIMYSTYMTAKVEPTAFYALDAHLFILTRKKRCCDCAKELVQFESNDPLTPEQFVQFLQQEFNFAIPYKQQAIVTSCAICKALGSEQVLP